MKGRWQVGTDKGKEGDCACLTLARKDLGCNTQSLKSILFTWVCCRRCGRNCPEPPTYTHPKQVSVTREMAPWTKSWLYKSDDLSLDISIHVKAQIWQCACLKSLHS